MTETFSSDSECCFNNPDNLIIDLADRSGEKFKIHLFNIFVYIYIIYSCCINSHDSTDLRKSCEFMRSVVQLLPINLWIDFLLVLFYYYYYYYYYCCCYYNFREFIQQICIIWYNSLMYLQSRYIKYYSILCTLLTVA